MSVNPGSGETSGFPTNPLAGLASLGYDVRALGHPLSSLANPVAPPAPVQAPRPAETGPAAPVGATASRLAGAAALIGTGTAEGGRWSQLKANADVREGTKAVGRLLANSGITVIDVVPWVGDAVSWGADAAKFSRKLNVLTPDVKKRWAIGTEILELIPFFPTHGIETVMQLRHDWRRIRAGFGAARAILRGQQPATTPTPTPAPAPTPRHTTR